jgi:cytochrome P450
LERLAADGAPYARFTLPWRKFIFLNDPDLIRDVLVTQQSAFTKSEGGRALRMILGEGLLTSDEPRHRQMRRIVQPAFHHARIAAYARTMQRHADRFCAGLVADVPTDARAAAAELTLGIATDTLFGTDSREAASTVSAALRELLEYYPHLLSPLGRLRRALRVRQDPRTLRAIRQLDEIVYGLIARRRKDYAQRDDVLSLLLEAEQAEHAEIDDRQIRDEVMTLFIAGHETTANALAWTWYLLSQNNVADAKLAAAGGDAASQYVGRVARESMRIYPPAWIIGREPLRDVELASGIRVRRTTTVLMSPLVLHRTKRFFANPMQFDPDRWERDAAPNTYLPFGAGSRRCIGEEFAWMELSIVLSTVAAAWRLELDPSTRIAMQPLVTLRPKYPVTVIPRRR